MMPLNLKQQKNIFDCQRGLALFSLLGLQPNMRIKLLWLTLNLQLSFQQNTPLHTAAEASNLRAVQYLVDKGADVNNRNYCGVSV